MPPEANTNFQQLRDYIQHWVESNGTNWSRLFKTANLSNGTMMSFRNMEYLASPSIRTLQRLADAMDVDPQILYIKAGLIDGDSDALGRIHAEYDLTPDEKALIDNVRVISERQRRIVMNTARGLAEDGDGV